jgi:hypothetical protein
MTLTDARLIERANVEIEAHRRALLDVASGASGGLLDATAEVAVSQILIGCRHILDRAMNATWDAHNTRQPEKAKANVYFPCRDSAQGLAEHLARAQLGTLEQANPAVFNSIKSCQPFVNVLDGWLKELFLLTQDKHESYVEIESVWHREMRIGEGQSGKLYGLVVMKDGRAFADAEMVDSATGKPAPLRLTFTERLSHLLKRTGQNPVDYSSRCIDRVEGVFGKIMAALP